MADLCYYFSRFALGLIRLPVCSRFVLGLTYLPVCSRDVLGADVSEPEALPEHGVRTVFIDLGNTKLELLHPLGPDSPITVIQPCPDPT